MATRMKVALVINELNIRGGTHKQLLRLSSYLLNQGHEVKIFTKFYNQQLSFPESNNMDVISYEKYFSSQNTLADKFKRLYGYFRMASDIANFSNIVNIHDNGFALIQVLFWVWYPKVKIIWQINDLPTFFSVGNAAEAKPTFSANITKKLYRTVGDKAKYITVNVSKNAERIKTHYNAVAKVIYCGVDLKRGELQTLQKKSTTLQLISIGVFFPYRNYETFVKVVDYINAELNVICNGIIVGSTALDPGYAKKINTMIEDQGINCKILGNISEKELDDVYNESDFFLFLNKDQSWGLAVFEAMNMGIPVILSESVGATELLEHNKHAIIINPTDYKEIAKNILHLSKNKELKQVLVTNAFNHTKTMTWDNMYSKKVEELLQCL